MGLDEKVSTELTRAQFFMLLGQQERELIEEVQDIRDTARKLRYYEAHNYNVKFYLSNKQQLAYTIVEKGKIGFNPGNTE